MVITQTMTPHAIALVGFTSFEHSAFESFFRLARRQPGFRIVDDLGAAALILANADDLDVMRDLVAMAPRQPCCSSARPAAARPGPCSSAPSSS
jgi:hypothetical protein